MLPVNYVRIHTISKKRTPQIHIPIEMSKSVGELKEKIYEKTKIKETSQILKFKQEKKIALLKDNETLESYGITTNSVITLKKFFFEENEEGQSNFEEYLEEECSDEEHNNQVMNINKRIDFYGNLKWANRNFEMSVIQEEKNEDFGNDDEDSKLIFFQKRFLLFCQKNIKGETNQIIEYLSKLTVALLKEVVEFQDQNGFTCLHFLIENQMDFVINFLIKNLDKELLKIHGENCPTPLILAMMKVRVLFGLGSFCYFRDSQNSNCWI